MFVLRFVLFRFEGPALDGFFRTIRFREFRKYRDTEISRRDEYSRRIPNVSELAKIAKNAFFRDFSRFFAKKSRKNAFFRDFCYSRVSVIAFCRKLGSEWVFRAFSELVPSREYSFRLENRPEISVKSSECRALILIFFSIMLNKKMFVP